MIKCDEAREVRQAGFADYLSGAGKLAQLRNWWYDISWLIVKRNMEKSAREIFDGNDVCITTDEAPWRIYWFR